MIRCRPHGRFVTEKPQWSRINETHERTKKPIKKRTCYDLSQLGSATSFDEDINETIARINRLSMEDDEITYIPHSKSAPDMLDNKPLLPELPPNAQDDIARVQQLFNQKADEVLRKLVEGLDSFPTVQCEQITLGPFFFGSPPKQHIANEDQNIATAYPWTDENPFTL